MKLVITAELQTEDSAGNPVVVNLQVPEMIQAWIRGAVFVSYTCSKCGKSNCISSTGDYARCIDCMSEAREDEALSAEMDENHFSISFIAITHVANRISRLLNKEV